MEARDPYVERRLADLERRVAALEAEVAALRGEEVTAEQPMGQLEAGHQAFVERLREAKR
jgi:hypothetical protein